MKACVVTQGGWGSHTVTKRGKGRAMPHCVNWYCGMSVWSGPDYCLSSGVCEGRHLSGFSGQLHSNGPTRYSGQLIFDPKLTSGQFHSNQNLTSLASGQSLDRTGQSLDHWSVA